MLYCYRYRGAFIDISALASFLSCDAAPVAQLHSAAIGAGEELIFQQLLCQCRNTMPLVLTF
jgi:hypothetical protein